MPPCKYNRRLLLEARAVEKSYGGVRALKHVSFHLRAGEVHALVGENGAGKSTLIKVFTGAVIPDSGAVLFNGTPVEDNSPLRSRALGIAAIYQQPAIFPGLTVAENIALASEAGGLVRRVDWRTRRQRAIELLKRVGAEIHPDREAGSLSMPEQQLVEIAKALGANVKVLILDEPTASLTDREAQRLFAIVKNLREQGTGIVYISHRLEELAQIADRITVLRDGETIETREASQTDTRTLIRLMAGRDLSAIFPKRAVKIGAPVLVLDEFTVHAGEILGIAGLVGAGRTELAERIFGLRPGGNPAIRNPVFRNPEDAIRAGIAYVPEDRRKHGIAAGLPVRANITLAILKRIQSATLLRQSHERDIAGNWIQQLGIKTDSADANAGSLSGGNQQKVAIARWLATKPRVLILDEPTQGIDVGAKAECHRIMCDLAEKGMAIVMISSELAEILGMSDRIAVMRNHKVTRILTREEATAESILEAALA